MFDVRRPDGALTGRVKTREDVHRDGDWHGTAHIWLVRRHGGKLQVLLQKRSRKKETFPGCFDTSCAGHLSAGDSFEEGALRELSELGRPVYHRSTQVKHSLVRKSLDDDLITYPVAIPLRYSYCQFLSHIIRFT